MAEWQSGHAADCKSVYAGSIPTSASKVNMKKISKAIIPVAGLGTRMLPATKAIPKELLPIIDKPLIQYVVEEAIKAGIKEIVLVTRSGKEAIENHFDANYELEHRLENSGKKRILKSIKNVLSKNVIISSVRQESALGLGHAISCAKHIINGEDFAVLLPDEILISENKEGDFNRMMNFYKMNNEGQILVERVKKKEIQKYGIVSLNKKEFKKDVPKKIYKIVEKPKSNLAPSNCRVVGRYILPFEVMSYLSKALPDKKGEIQLTDALDKFIKEGRRPLNAILSDSRVFDCGSKIGFLAANVTMASKDRELKKFIKEIMN